MKNNVKAILKTKTPLFFFNYDEDSYAACGLFDDGVEIMDKMDKTEVIEKLINVGMNRGFSKRIQDVLKNLLKIRSKLWDNTKLKPGGWGTRGMWRDFENVLKQALPIFEEITSGFRPELVTHLDSAKKKLSAVASPSFAYKFDGLYALAGSCKTLLDEISVLLDDVIDVSSTEAAKSAQQIIAYIERWNTEMLYAIEDGTVENTKTVTDPLVKARDIAKAWSEALTGVSPSNPTAQAGAVKKYDSASDQLAVLIA